jgi:FlaG/FlaF family flagellin (archaellin)
MKQQKRNFRSDTKAVSEVIGMVPLLAILVTFFTIIQVSVVPAWNKQVEAAHIPAVYDDMTSLSSDI